MNLKSYLYLLDYNFVWYQIYKTLQVYANRVHKNMFICQTYIDIDIFIRKSINRIPMLSKRTSRHITPTTHSIFSCRPKCKGRWKFVFRVVRANNVANYLFCGTLLNRWREYKYFHFSLPYLKKTLCEKRPISISSLFNFIKIYILNGLH